MRRRQFAQPQFRCRETVAIAPEADVWHPSDDRADIVDEVKDVLSGNNAYRTLERNSLVRGSLARAKKSAGGACSTITPLSVK